MEVVMVNPLGWRLEWTIPLLFDFVFLKMIGSHDDKRSERWNGRNYSLRAIRALMSKCGTDEMPGENRIQKLL